MAEIPFGRINWVDVLTLILLFRMGYIGFQLGLPAELVKLFAAVGGLCLGFFYYQTAGDILAAHTFLGVEWASVLAMAVLVSGGYFLFTRFFRWVGRLGQMSFEKRLNQVGGLIIGLVRAVLVTSIVLVTCLQFSAASMQESIEQNSMSGKAISRVAPAVYDTLTGFVRRFRN